MQNNIEAATTAIKEGLQEGVGAFRAEVKAQWKPYLPLFLAFGLGVVLARWVLPAQRDE
jgi:hypothetical protein